MARIRALPGTLLVVAALVIGLCFGLYAHGASGLPDDLEPNRYRATPDLRALYLAVNAGGIQDVPRLNPVSVWGYWLWHFSGRQHEPLGSQLTLLGDSGRSLMMRQPRPAGSTQWHPARLAATVRVSRQWEMDGMVDTLLAEGAFGRGATGIEQAARAWYGRPLGELVVEERLLLVVLMRSPSHHDPACHPERFADRYRWGAAHAGIPDAADALRIAMARMRPVACPASRSAPAP